MLDLLKFDITARNAQARGAMNDMKSDLRGIKGALAGVNDTAKRWGRSMRNVGAGLSAGVTAPLTLLGRDAVRLYDTQVKAEKAVAQAIASTGGAAGKTIDDLKGLASALQNVTTYGDEDILRNVTAPLLTFTKVQGDVFDRAQANVLDMAELLKMDLKSASILVGKALNDPIKGVGALSKSGVQFTEDQKKVIASLVETGDVAAAQTIILKELETQFAGQAAAAASTPLGQWTQMSNAIGDIKEELGAQITPFLKPLVENVREAVAWFASLSPEIKRTIVVVGGLAAAVGPVLGILGLATLGVSGLTSALGAMGAALLANPILAVIALIAGGAYLIYRNWDNIGPWFREKWGQVQQWTSAAWTSIQGRIAAVRDWIATKWDDMGGYFRLLWDRIGAWTAVGWGLIQVKIGAVRDAIPAIWDSIADYFSGLWDRIVGLFRRKWDEIKAIFATAFDDMKQIGRSLMEGLAGGIFDSSDKPTNAAGSAIRKTIGSARKEADVQSPSRVFHDIGGYLMEGLALGIADNADQPVSAMTSAVTALKDTAESGLDLMGSLRDGAKSIFRDVLTGAQSFRSSLSSVLSGIGGRLINSGIDMLFNAIWPSAKGNVLSGGRITPFASGGVVSGPTMFPMRGGMGLMGEAGPEAIMPLARAADGSLGVRSQGGTGAQRIEIVVSAAEGATVEDVRRIAGDVAVAVTQQGLATYDAGFGGRVEEYGARGTHR